jgi:uncharacterized protein (DUF2249 family)
MNLNQWVEISSIIGHLDGMATIMDVTDDIEPKRIKDSLVKIKERLQALHTELGPEVLEYEKKKAEKPVTKKEGKK